MRKLLIPALLLCMLSLQSCFDVIEQIVLKNDGTGSLQVVLNMSRSKTRLNSVMKMKTVNGHKVPSQQEIRKEAASLENDIKSVPGISNFAIAIDFENFIAKLNCDFKSLNNVNEGIYKIAATSKKQISREKSFDFDPVSKLFSRLNKFFVKDDYEKLSAADKEIFATASYTSIFRFETTVDKVSNNASRISSDKKAVMLKLPALDIITNKQSIENKIQLK
ncbi:MAG: hypothetical protein JST81_02135 [Bacteroidetes bacterium]|nr:hypothetical protein [Bacteroidota bacterium]